MTEQGQAVLDRRAALAALERGTLPDCVCGCPWRRHLGRAGVGACQCGCQGYRDTADPEPDARLWTSEERKAARQARRDQQAYEAIHQPRRDADR
jgi:hypothetical protein